jgi:ribonuclease Z
LRLARDADILIHEATGEGAWHSSAAQAGEIASQAGVKTLYLTHYSSKNKNLRLLVEQAQESFSGAVHLAEDWMEISL